MTHPGIDGSGTTARPPKAAGAARQTAVVFMILLVMLILVITARLCVGEQFGWPAGDLRGTMGRLLTAGWWGSAGGEHFSILDIRLLRVVLAVMAGVALSTSGVALQALLRNPLAEPFILGLSSGAAAGIMAQMVLSQYLQQHFAARHVGALMGAALSMAIVYLASRRRGAIDPLGLLLVGVVLSTVNGAVIMLLNYMSDSAGLRADIARWMMGHLNEGVGQRELWVVSAVCVVGLVVLWVQGRAMDAATLTDDEAISVGVHLTRLRTLLFTVSSALAAAAVVLAGPIAFVGLICPHIARLVLGPSHRALLVASAVLGATLLLLADTAAVALDFGQGRLPLGIFTALIGGPVFIWMLRPKLGHQFEG